MIKTNVAIINSVCNYGSTGRISYEFSQFLNNQSNYSSKVYYGRGKKDKCNYKFSNIFLVSFNAFLARIFDCEGRISIISTLLLLRKLKKDNVSIIVLNNIHGYYLNYKMLINFINKHQIKLLWIFHDCWNFTGHCSHFDYIGCEKFKSECFSCPNKKEYPKSLFLDNSKSNYKLKKKVFSSLSETNTIIVSPSKWLESKIKVSFFNKYECNVVNNGIDTEVFSFDNRDHPNKSIIILCIANIWTEKKGFKDVLRLNEIIDHNRFQIMMVGKLSKGIVLPDNIIRIEQTSSSFELANIYRKANVLFNPTYEDTFSNVNMEALSCGCRVVCYETGGATEMLSRDSVVKKGDVLGAYNIIKNINWKQKNVVDYDFSKINAYKKYLYLIEKLVSCH